MSKYILNTDGSIRKIDGDLTIPEVNISGILFKDRNKENVVTSFSGAMNSDDILDFGEPFNFDILNNNITQTKHTSGITENGKPFNSGESSLHNPSFGGKEDILSFKNFNSIQEKDAKNESIFANEFEILTGYSFNSLTFDDVAREKWLTKLTFFIPFITESIVHIIVCETLLRLSEEVNSGAGMHASQTTDVEENFHLALGDYTLTDTNILQTYISKTLNYPKSKMSHGIGFLERISAFLVGLNEFINTTGAVDYKKIFSDKHHLSNDITGKDSITSTALNYEKILSATLNIIAESILSASLSSTNRLYMVARKIQNQKIWSENLYKAKKNSNDKDFLQFFDKSLVEMNYYWFRFVIERMHVGYKLIRYYKFNTSVNKGINRESIHFLSRVNRSEMIGLHEIKGGEWKYSRSGKNNSLTTSMRSLPQGFIIPETFIRSQILHDNKFSFGVDESIIQNFRIKKENEGFGKRRLSNAEVASIENYLDSTYMPFYFHDLRTNEIMSFHAFINSVTDNFTPVYAPHTGFGRIDDVQHYTKTSRSISVSFTVAATSKEDFDLMWFQINKLVSLCYPQWSRGTVNNKDGKLKGTNLPFTQVPTASPLIRLRLGDVLSSNYSKKNISRIHGLENSESLNSVGVSSLEFNQEIKNKTKEAAINIQKLENTVNSVQSTAELISSTALDRPTIADDLLNTNHNRITLSDKIKNVKKERNANVKEFLDSYKSDTKKYLIPGRYKIIRIEELFGFGPETYIPGLDYAGSTSYIHLKDYLPVEIVEEKDIPASLNVNDGVVVLKSLVNNGTLNDMIIADSYSLVTKEEYLPNASYLTQQPVLDAKEHLMDHIKAYDSGEELHNPIIAAYQSTLGKGLAGFITSLNLDYNDQVWETSKDNKAPKLVKVSIQFNPIHDIPMGLDDRGMMRAPAYNVGELNRSFFGHQYNSKDIKS